MSTHTCPECQSTFATKDGMLQHHLGKHTSKEDRKAVVQQWRKEGVGKQTRKEWIFIGLVAALVLFGGYFAYTGMAVGTYSEGQVHWHSGVVMTVCGENVAFPSPSSENTVHGQSFIGSTLMHLHEEPKVHIEGTVSQAEDITLAAFMKNVGLTFTDTQLLDYSNGDTCPDGIVGTVQLLVNGVESDELSGKVLVDGDNYEMIFG